MANNKANASKFNPKGDKPIFQWESPDRPTYKRKSSWYVGLILAAALLGYLLYMQHIYTGVALVAAAALVFILFSQSKPRVMKCAVYNKGVVVDEKVYRYNECKFFWMSYADIPKAKLQLNGMAAGQVIMPISNIDPEQIRMYLTKHLPEDEDRGEDLVDIVNRFLKF